MSQLAQALKPHAKHYREVWREWERLGEDAFLNQHYSRDIHFRLKQITLENLGYPRLPNSDHDRAPRTFGPDLRADKYSLARHGVITLEDGSRWGIDKDEPAGWYFGHPNAEGTALEGETHGVEFTEGGGDRQPFRLSSDAFDAIHEVNGYQSPRPKPGRPRQ